MTIVIYPLPGDVPRVGVFEGAIVGMDTGGIIGEFSQSGLVSSLSKHSHPLTTPCRQMPRPAQLAGQYDLSQFEHITVRNKE